MILSLLQITWYLTKEKNIKKKKQNTSKLLKLQAEDQFFNLFTNKDGEKGIW